MSTEIAHINGFRSELAVIDSPPVDIAKLKQQVQLIGEAMRSVMVPEVHYGVVPGTGTKDKPGKPSLFKAGSEVICLMFRLRPEFTETVTELPGGHREYKFTCKLYTPDGQVMGMGSGSCSTMESKYRWRGGQRLCPECGKPTIIKGKAEYGGGYLCYAKKGGCGAKFPDGAKEIESQALERTENPDIADLYNTVLKIALKRAQVDATLRTTAASGIFTQDAEDLPDYMLRNAIPVVAEETAKPEAAPTPKAKQKAKEKIADAMPEEVPPPPPPVEGELVANCWLYQLETERWKSAEGTRKGKRLISIWLESPERFREVVTVSAYAQKLTANDFANMKACLAAWDADEAEEQIKQAIAIIQLEEGK